MVMYLSVGLRYDNNSLRLRWRNHKRRQSQLLSRTVRKIANVVSEASESESSLDRSFESCTNSYDFCVHFVNKAD